MIKLSKIISLILLINILSTILIGCQTKLERIQIDLNNNKLDDAVNDIKTIRKDDEKRLAIDMVNNKFEEIKQDFYNGTTDGTRSISNMQKFREINGVEDILSKDIEEINNIMNSQKSFIDGLRAEKEKDYDLAYESYYNVSKDDKTNYEKAQAKLLELEPILKNISPVSVQKSQIIITSKTKKDLYPDQIQVIIKNNSNKAIGNFTISFLGFDSNGNPVEIEGRNSIQKDYEFLGIADNISIEPNKIWGAQYGWSIISNNSISTVLACIKEIKYADGTSWNNPLYRTWLDKNKQNQPVS